MVKRIIPRLKQKMVWKKLGAGPLRKGYVVRDMSGWGTRLRGHPTLGATRRDPMFPRIRRAAMLQRFHLMTGRRAVLDNRRAILLERRMRGPSLRMKLLMWRKSVEGAARRERTPRSLAIRRRYPARSFSYSPAY